MQTSWILVVDDDPELCRAMLSALSGGRLPATACRRATVAVDLLRSTPTLPDVLVTDAYLPDLSGLELIRTLAGEGIHLPTLLVSGIHVALSADQLWSLGCNDYLEKPFQAREFLDRIRSLQTTALSPRALPHPT